MTAAGQRSAAVFPNDRNHIDCHVTQTHLSRPRMAAQFYRRRLCHLHAAPFGSADGGHGPLGRYYAVKKER